MALQLPRRGHGELIFLGSRDRMPGNGSKMHQEGSDFSFFVEAGFHGPWREIRWVFGYF